MIVGLQPQDPPLCNLPIVSSALGLPFIVLWQERWAFMAPLYYLLPVRTLMSGPSGEWTEKKKNDGSCPASWSCRTSTWRGSFLLSRPLRPLRESPPLLLLLVLLLVPSWWLLLELSPSIWCSLLVWELLWIQAGGTPEEKNGELTTGSVVLRSLVLFPNPPATIYFSESSDSYSMHSVQDLWLHSVGDTR